jgi:5'-phosphate synthase pdxT subunit
LDVTVTRNQFGRQQNSFEGQIKSLLASADGQQDVPGVFIRAPAIISVGSNAKVIATLRYKDQPEQPVAVKQGHLYGLTFHPELTGDMRWHSDFLRCVLERQQVNEIRSTEQNNNVQMIQ